MIFSLNSPFLVNSGCSFPSFPVSFYLTGVHSHWLAPHHAYVGRNSCRINPHSPGTIECQSQARGCVTIGSETNPTSVDLNYPACSAYIAESSVNSADVFSGESEETLCCLGYFEPPTLVNYKWVSAFLSLQFPTPNSLSRCPQAAFAISIP